MNVLRIACDESGAEGENVAEAQHRVFCHGSVGLAVDEAQGLVEQLRAIVGSQGTELKATRVLDNVRAREVLFGAASPLRGRAQMYLVDKQYFLVAKVIDLLIEELAHARGRDIYGDGQARKLAVGLFHEGPRALGVPLWKELLVSFNSLMRIKQRKGVKETLDGFFGVVSLAERRSHRRKVSEALELVREARTHADRFQQFITDHPNTEPTLDPLIAALPMTIRIWAQRSGEEIDVVHDDQSALTESVVAEILRHLRRPLPEFERFAPPIRVAGITLVNSKADPRVQIADFVAGGGRWAATEALRGGNAPAHLVRSFVSPESIWADEPSFDLLRGTRSHFGAEGPPF